MRYNFPSNELPDPTNYKASYCECRWDEYQQDSGDGTGDWGFYTEAGSNITDCATCMQKCSLDSNCGSVECGTNQTLIDGTVITPHCTWWRTGVCETAQEFKLNPHNLIITAKKKGM